MKITFKIKDENLFKEAFEKLLNYQKEIKVQTGTDEDESPIYEMQENPVSLEEAIKEHWCHKMCEVVATYQKRKQIEELEEPAKIEIT